MTPAELRERTGRELIARLDALVAMATDIQAFEASQSSDDRALSAALAVLVGYYSQLFAMAQVAQYAPAPTGVDTSRYLH